MATTQPVAHATRRKLDEAKPLLWVDGLGVSFDNGSGPRIQAVDGVRMTVYPRQTIAVVGESDRTTR